MGQLFSLRVPPRGVSRHIPDQHDTTCLVKEAAKRATWKVADVAATALKEAGKGAPERRPAKRPARGPRPGVMGQEICLPSFDRFLD
jgi:hypothetical protein